MKKKNQGVLEEGWAGKVQDESGMPVYARKNDGTYRNNSEASSERLPQVIAETI